MSEIAPEIQTIEDVRTKKETEELMMMSKEEVVNLLLLEQSNNRKLTEKIKLLSQEIRTDYLTNLPNSRALKEHVDQLDAECRRRPEINGLMVYADTDWLKEVNDIGRPVGDKLLKNVAGIPDVLRDTDIMYRLGTASDEFVIIMPYATRPDFEENISKRILDYLKDRELELQREYSNARVSISMVVSEYNSEKLPGKVLEETQFHMNEAKQNKFKETGKRGSSVGVIYLP